MAKIKESVVEIFRVRVEEMHENDGEPPLPEGAPDWHDGSEIMFHASQIVQARTFPRN